MLYTNENLKAYYEWRTMVVRTYQDGLYVAKNCRSQYDAQECCSNDHGMGMLAAVTCGQKEDFDGLFKHYKRFRNKDGLMVFFLTMEKKGRFIPKSDCDASSRTSADLDIATSLFLAKRKWGYGGRQEQVDYGAEATNLARCIWEHCFNQDTYMPFIGDWATNDYWGKRVRPDHFILDGYWIMQQEDAERHEEWAQVIERIITLLQEQLALQPKTGLLANQLVLDSKGVYVPDPGKMMGMTFGNLYGKYSCAAPWRISRYYALTGDVRVKAILETQGIFFATELRKGGIDTNYQLDGRRTGTPMYLKSHASPVRYLFGALGWTVHYNNMTDKMDDTVSDNDSHEHTIDLICALQQIGKVETIG